MSEGMSEPAHRIRELEAEERSLSARRARLQNRIDFLRSGGGGPLDEVAGTLDALVDEEREVSTRRRALHAEIETVRAELIRARS
jgi:chromosome segregation ATPase